jgi:two-component system, OmpR family, response regulator
MNATALKVLVIDDEEMVRTNLRLFLEDEGFAVTIAASAEEALLALQDNTFDVAVVDIRLPGMDGNAFVLEAHRRRPRLRYVIHTGSSNYALPDDVEAVGVRREHVFLKPLHDMTPMSKAIRSICPAAG